MSLIFTPFYLPIVGLIALFTFSYLSIMPWQYKLSVVFMVYLFTILFPTLLIHVYRRYQGWTPLEMGKKERRMVPYIIAILCYFCCYYIMSLLRIPQFMANILVAALMIQIVCAVINVRSVLYSLCLQPDLVVLSRDSHRGTGGQQPHDPAAAYTHAGGCRLPRGRCPGLLDYSVGCKNNLAAGEQIKTSIRYHRFKRHKYETISKYHHGFDK